MKALACLAALGVLSAQAASSSGAQTAANTNALLRVAPNNAASAHSPAPSRLGFGVIATNTPDFEKYAFHLMLTNGNLFREKWHLDIPEPLSVSNVYFTVKAMIGGVGGAMATRDHRFRWNFFNNGISAFGDTNNCAHSWRYNDDAEGRLAKIKSKITAKEAEAIARERLHQLGLTEKQLKLIEPPEVNQYKFEESDGTVYPLPMFHVVWGEQRLVEKSLAVSFNISGITKQVSDFFMASMSRPPMPVPTNYYNMLGLRAPTNLRETLGLTSLKPSAPAMTTEK